MDAYARCGRMPEAEACLHETTKRSKRRGAAAVITQRGHSFLSSVQTYKTLAATWNCPPQDPCIACVALWQRVSEVWNGSILQQLHVVTWVQACHLPWKRMALSWRATRGAGMRTWRFPRCKTSLSWAGSQTFKCLTPSWMSACAPATSDEPCRWGHHHNH